ncbi:MAG: hypothetical protein Kow0047_24000 [Anaerolineae bacterium]
MKRFYSIKEAAKYLDVDYKVVYRLVKEGEIRATRVGWQYRIAQEDLQAYLNTQRMRQIIEAAERSGSLEPAAMAETTREISPPSNGVHARGVSRLRARQMEQSFIHRFDEKVRSIGTIRHPITHKALSVEDWEALHTVRDERERLMEALNTAFLDRRTLATTPRNVASRYTVPGSPGLVLEARVVAHLEAFCQQGEDEGPASAEDLMEAIDEIEEEQQQTKAAYVIGLASPTGWTEEAIEYITGVGQAYRNRYVRLFLIDLQTEAVYYNEYDPETASFAGLFQLTMEWEEIAELQEHLKAEVAERTGVVLHEFAQELGVSEDLVLRAARSLEAENGYRLVSDREEGWILFTHA